MWPSIIEQKAKHDRIPKLICNEIKYQYVEIQARQNFITTTHSSVTDTTEASKLILSRISISATQQLELVEYYNLL